MAHRGPLPTQPTMIDRLAILSELHGYKCNKTKKDKNTESIKVFYPDLVAEPHKNAPRRVFEVEVTVTNNTIFKSLVSVFTFLAENSKSCGHLVVPKAKVEFAEKCTKHLIWIIRTCDRGTKGAPIKSKN